MQGTGTGTAEVRTSAAGDGRWVPVQVSYRQPGLGANARPACKNRQAAWREKTVEHLKSNIDPLMPAQYLTWMSNRWII